MADDNVDILFMAPHPDDIEIGMGGAVAKLARQGYRVGMLHLTSGEPTPRGNPKTRVKESAAAAQILGAHFCKTLTLPNRELMDCPENRYPVATIIRQLRPRILVCMAGRTPAASPDHYQSQLIAEASRFYSQLTKWDDRFDGTEPFRVDHLLYRPVPFAAEIPHYPSRLVLDITDTIDIKIEALSCYRSQFDGQRLERISHYIRSIAGAEGAWAGFAFGEMYALPRPIGTSDLIKTVGDWKIPTPFAKVSMQPGALDWTI